MAAPFAYVGLNIEFSGVGIEIFQIFVPKDLHVPKGLAHELAGKVIPGLAGAQIRVGIEIQTVVVDDQLPFQGLAV